MQKVQNIENMQTFKDENDDITLFIELNQTLFESDKNIAEELKKEIDTTIELLKEL